MANISPRHPTDQDDHGNKAQDTFMQQMDEYRRRKADEYKRDNTADNASSADTAMIKRFNALAARWKEDTAIISNIHEIIEHDAYREIISMGKPVIPLILQEMAREPGHWFGALHALTGASPIPPEHAGRIYEMTEAWLKWGADNGYGTFTVSS